MHAFVGQECTYASTQRVGKANPVVTRSKHSRRQQGSQMVSSMCRRCLIAAAAISLQATAVHLVLHWSQFGLPGESTWPTHTTKLFASLLYYGSPFCALLASATMLALITRSDPLHSCAASLLASQPLVRLANLSYSLYLIAEQARYWAMLYLLPVDFLPALISSAPVPGLVFFCVFSLGAGYFCSYLLTYLMTIIFRKRA
jgi:hypothetical protein